MGRPKTTVRSEELTERVEIRCTAAELKRWRKAAEADSRPLSSWVRRMLDAAAKTT